MATRIRRTSKPTYSAGIGAAISAPIKTAAPLPAPAAPTPPPDPVLIAQQANAQNALTLGGIGDQYSLGQIENEYGYGADVSNPYSRAMLQKMQYEQNQRASVNSQYNAGYGSGAAQDRTDYNARQYAIQDDASRRAYEAAKAGVAQGAISRYATSGTALTQDQLDAIRRALGMT